MWTWYASRAAGLVSLVLLSGSVLLGIGGVTRAASARWRRFAVQRLHRNLSMLAVAFVALHVLTAVLDGYVPIAWLDVLLPFTSAYEPWWLGLGTVALDLLLAVLVTSLLRVRLGLRAWRAVHRAAYVCWPVAVLHGIGLGGADTTTWWVLALTLACVAAVGVGLVRRTTVGTRP
ncbi:ferric reductase-like transmembrane domain-containing protein [Pseudonocardia sp. WMMC193]|uniref:ferric reductase-like transmembrane domain-containing protein n=1 Tax=Pseudonocardia sp. WMMC193 TaxID=2911965 RepID=UPI001F27B961|nr:ferric reductase-like transmembrane domain-containing protein [Pseudonocardia sp. WMMC193]MCF7548637.1 ferric reductase-like transmembrane domain-containing protein [Pseudonocardia sp. WMMC193]